MAPEHPAQSLQVDKQSGTVTWSSSRGLFTRFSYRPPPHLAGSIVAAAFGLTPRHLCVVSQLWLTLIDVETGEVFEVPVPGDATPPATFVAVRPLASEVLLIELQLSQGAPWYGVLRHPLEELRPVAGLSLADSIVYSSTHSEMPIFVSTNPSRPNDTLVHRLTDPDAIVDALATCPIVRAPRSKVLYAPVLDAALSHALDGSWLLSLLCSDGELAAWKFSAGEWIPAFARSGVSAIVGAEATREGLLDLVLILKERGQVSVTINGFDVVPRLPELLNVRARRFVQAQDSKLVIEVDDLNQTRDLDLSEWRPSCLLTSEVLGLIDEFLPPVHSIAIRRSISLSRICNNASDWTMLCEALGVSTKTKFPIPEEFDVQDDPWQLFMDNRLHRDRSASEFVRRCRTPGVQSACKNISPAASRDLIDILQLLYESCRLDRLLYRWMDELAELILRLLLLRFQDSFDAYLDHFVRDLGERIPSDLLIGWSTHSLDRGGQRPFDLVRLLESKTTQTGSNPMARFGVSRSHKIQKLFSAVRIYDAALNHNSPASATLRQLAKEKWRPSDIANLPPGIGLPISQALWSCRRTPDENWSIEMLQLIGRPDLRSASGDANVGHQSGLSKYRIRPRVGQSSHPPSSAIAMHPNNDDGCNVDDVVLASLRFRADRRLVEVRKLLRSSEPVRLTAGPTAVSGEATESDHQAEMIKTLMKTLASPVGRGAFTLGIHLRRDAAEPLHIPKLCLAGRLPDSKGALSHLNIDNMPERSLDWPHFHNGVAAGLRLGGPPDEDQNAIRSWILGNKADQGSQGATHAGVLLALGFNGCLNSLRKSDWYEYMMPRNEVLAIGLMLGLGCAKRGTMDLMAQKLMCMHIRHFSETAFAQPDWSATPYVQSAALVSVGLLFQGTGNRMMAEGMLSELSRRTKPGDTDDGRECLALSAGMALGLTCMGLGEEADSLLNIQLEDTLVRLICGGRRSEHPPVSPSTDDSNPLLIHDGKFVNIGLTAPGALMAFALIHLQTDNRRAASRIQFPETDFDLERVRADHLLLRVLVRAIILWREIAPNKEWVSSCIAPALSFGDATAAEGLFDPNLMKTPGTSASEDYDSEALIHGRVATLAACCMALALKFAGSRLKAAQDIIVQSVDTVANISGTAGSHANNMINVGLDFCLLASSIVMSGSGDLETLRMLRKYSKRHASSRSYGSHMASSMALGFLFAGSGSITFGTSRKAISALLCSVFPRFPSGPLDNKYHLQALRHLYVLAVERRLFESRDVDSGDPCTVPIQVSLRSGESYEDTAPCILPSLEEIESVSVDNPRYWSLRVTADELQRGRLAHPLMGFQIGVQRRYEQNRFGQKMSTSQSSLIVGVPVNRDSLGGRGADAISLTSKVFSPFGSDDGDSGRVSFELEKSLQSVTGTGTFVRGAAADLRFLQTYVQSRWALKRTEKEDHPLGDEFFENLLARLESSLALSKSDVHHAVDEYLRSGWTPGSASYASVVGWLEVPRAVFVGSLRRAGARSGLDGLGVLASAEGMHPLGAKAFDEAARRLVGRA